MKLATTTLVLLLVCSGVLKADEKPKTPQLHATLQELAWLVGEWEVKPLESPPSPPRATRGTAIYRTNPEIPSDNSATYLSDLSIAPDAKGTSLVVSYNLESLEWALDMACLTSRVEERIMFDAASECFVVEYDWQRTLKSHAGRGRYSLTKTSGNTWAGDATYKYGPVRSPQGSDTEPPPQRVGTYSIELKKDGDDAFSVAFTNRVNCPLGPKEFTVHFLRAQENPK
jgi:hypothetical protein